MNTAIGLVAIAIINYHHQNVMGKSDRGEIQEEVLAKNLCIYSLVFQSLIGGH